MVVFDLHILPLITGQIAIVIINVGGIRSGRHAFGSRIAGSVVLHGIQVGSVWIVNIAQPVYLAVTIMEGAVLLALPVGALAVQGTDIPDLVVADVPLVVEAVVVVGGQVVFSIEGVVEAVKFVVEEAVALAVVADDLPV